MDIIQWYVTYAIQEEEKTCDELLIVYCLNGIQTSSSFTFREIFSL